MHHTVVIGTCLGLCLASHASAEQITFGPKNSQAKATVGEAVPARASARRSVHAVAAESTLSGRPSVFSYPAGLSTCAECLFERLGYYPAHCVPMTSDTTYDLAYACFIRGMYEDAIAFASHGLTLRDDARLYLIKGVSELHVGRCFEAEATVEQYLNAVDSKNLIGLAYARERINGPMRVRFEQIVKHVSSSIIVR